MEIINNIFTFIENNGAKGLIYFGIIGIIILVVRFGYVYIPIWIKKAATKEELRRIDKRIEADEFIRTKLDKLLLSTKADRAMIVEFHNGRENLCGLPFRCSTVMYEATRNENIERVGQKYQTMNLSMFSAPSYLLQHKYFLGSVDEFKKVDPLMGKYAEEDKSNYMAVILLRKDNINIGLLVLTYEEKQQGITTRIIAGSLSQYVQDISSVLTLHRHDRKDK